MGIFCLVVLGILIFVLMQAKNRTGYYTFTDSCKIDSDCVCIAVQGTTDVWDSCGKPGQYPGCVAGICRWKFSQ